MRKRIISIFMMVFLVFSIFAVGYDTIEEYIEAYKHPYSIPPGTWPVGVGLWHMDESNFFQLLTYGTYTAMNNIDSDATMGAISPDRKYIAYVKKGPYLVVKKFEDINRPLTYEEYAKGLKINEHGELVLEIESNYIYKIPWGARPVWSLDSKWIYFTRLGTHVWPDMDLLWYEHSAGIGAVNVETGEYETLTGTTYDIPNAIDPTTGDLLFTRLERNDEGFDAYIHRYNFETREVIKEQFWGHFPFKSPDNTLIYSGYYHTVTLVNPNKGFNWDYDDIEIIPKFTGYTAQAMTVNRTGSYVLVQALRGYRKYDPREPDRHFWNLFCLDMNTGEIKEFLTGYTSYSYPNFRYNSNELVLSIGGVY